MQDWEALKYFLTNLGLLNLALVILAAGVGVMLGRLVWSRSAQGLVQMRERMSVEVERAKDAEVEIERERERYRELREQVESGEGGTLVINSPELEEELEGLRERAVEADRTLEQMMLANEALESAVAALEAENAELSSGGTTGAEHDAAELAGLRAEIEVLRKESTDLRGERDEISGKLVEVKDSLVAAKDEGRTAKLKKGSEAKMAERVAVLEMELLDTRHERKQVEEASAILRKELYGMRHKLEEVEKRHNLEKELNHALRDAEQRLTRLQAEVAKGAVSRRAEGQEVVSAAEERRPEVSKEESKEEAEPELLVEAEVESEVEGVEEEEVVVRLEVVAGEDDGEESEGGADGEDSGESEGAEVEDDLTRIKGIGAVLARRLNEAGVTSFRQIAEWTPAEGKEISKKLSLRNRVESGDWRGQARALHLKAHREEI